ncbi:MAG: 6-phospho-beta-glucosidase [Microbacterium sp.]
MKLTVLGGGGFRTPYIFHELITRPDAPHIDELVLFDPSADRLAVIAAILVQMTGIAEVPVRTTTSAEDAITGADVVFAAVRTGGLDGRLHDERTALDLGVIGQETTGAGGISFALRTVPVMVEYARLIARTAPNALVINFTNPAGIITEAMQAVLGDRVIGICDTPSGLVRRVGELLGAPITELDYVGLNHLGWLRAAGVDGRDRLPELLADDERLAQLEETTVFGAEWIRALGAIPNEYLWYYYCTREALESLRHGSTRGAQLAQTQRELFTAVAADPRHALTIWLAAVRARNASYMADARGSLKAEDEPDDALFAESYAGVAVSVIVGLRGAGAAAPLIVNVRNAGAVAGLPDDAVVEIPALLTPDGIQRQSIAAPTEHQLGLMLQVKAVERLAIRAALTGDPKAALAAFAEHPLVDSVSVARRLRDEWRP